MLSVGNPTHIAKSHSRNIAQDSTVGYTSCVPQPPTTVRVTSVEPHGETKVRISMEMIVDVHRLADVGSEMLRAAMAQVKSEQRAKKKN